MFLFLKIINVKRREERAEIFFFTKPQIGSGSGSVAIYRSTSSTIFCNSRERERPEEGSVCLSVCLSVFKLFICVVMMMRKRVMMSFFSFSFFRKKKRESGQLESLFFCSLSLSNKSLFFFFSFERKNTLDRHTHTNNNNTL